MKDKSLANAELVEEISVLKQRIKDPEKSKRKPAEDETDRNREETVRVAEEMAIIAEISRVIGSTLDINEVYEHFAQHTKKLIPFDRLSLVLTNPDEGTYTVAYVSKLDLPGRRPGETLPLAGTFSEAVLLTQKGLFINAASAEDLTGRYPNLTANLAIRAGVCSVISVPLISRNEIFGVLHFQSKTANAYTERDLHLAERVGEQIAGAIANAQLFTNLKKAETEQYRCRETAERLAEEMAVIAEIGKVIGSSLNINEVYERFAAEVKKLIPFDRIGVNPINPHKGVITFTYISGIDIHAWQTGDVVPIAGTFSEIVMQTRTGLLINTTGEEDMARRFPSITNLAGIRWGIRSLITVPLISNDEVIAALHFRSIKPNAFNEQHLRLAEKIGMQISGTIANAQLFSELKDTEETLRRSEQLLQSYLDGAGDAIYVVKTDAGRILNCNMRACLDLGYSRDELLMLSAKDIETSFSSDQIDAFHSDVKHAGVKTLEGMHKRKDGSVFPVEIRLSLISPAQPELMISVVRDITERRRGEEELEGYRMNLEVMVKERTAELEIKNITLQELNTTLRVLLKQREDDKKAVEERFVMNIQNLVLPFVEQMKKGRLGAGQQTCLEIIETHLRDIATPLLKNIRQFNLTPKELKVAALVRNGRTTKEIAEILGIAAGSIDIHRNNIRRKLGLNSRRTNLQSYLETLE